MHSNERVNKDDLTYISSLSKAVLERPARSSVWILWTIAVVVAWLIFWASIAELDKIVRGEGKVVPSSRIQLVQNLEGGIIEQILVSSGAAVTQGQVLIQLDNTQFASTLGEKVVEQQALTAKALRLQAEAEDTTFAIPERVEAELEHALYARELSLFNERQKQTEIAVNIVRQQVIQHQTELDNAYDQQKQLLNSLALLDQEITMTEPLVRQGFASEVDLLKTKRERNDTFGKLNSVKLSIPKYQALITETEQKIAEIKQTRRNEAQEALNETLAKISQLQSVNVALEDKVSRTQIRSPVSGVISELLVNTLGEVVQPGSNLAKIVPVDDSLVLETRILPSDIGFIYAGLQAKVKFTAYDFAIYGGLDGEVEQVSADTITDEEGNSYYVARIRTNKNFLGDDNAPLYLMPGMVASVDIIVGKHTVLDYLLKPILKTKQLALRES
ncbi:HlyD family type I secretion periplasmic adaptor subunit [Vibrio parahaemolyticus]|uniref:HlyD family type I secretion periplasmic adaptor subunit n=1 Tax=Vibrio parahaemolyticus TaxID=670 RepID=UPI002EBC11C5|nr:HlyD family type I secretion periplasmic adaptor subunit [Pseudomonadota bacterium]